VKETTFVCPELECFIQQTTIMPWNKDIVKVYVCNPEKKAWGEVIEVSRKK
jgi:hypothetical protein